MAEQVLAITTAPGFYSQTGQVVTITANDVGGNNSIVVTSDCLVIAHNTDVGAQTVTITSTADPTFGRVGNVAAQSLAADEIRVFRLTRIGWANSNGLIIVSGSDANINFGVIAL